MTALAAPATPPSAKTVDMLAHLIGFDTTSRLSNMALVNFVRAHLDAHGVRYDVIPNADGTKANLYATIGPDGPDGIVLSGHTDVVPVDEQTWSSDPFTLDLRDGRYYGRGTSDMKGFVAAVLAKVPALTAKPLARPVHIALSYDEEIGCRGVRPMLDHIAAHYPRPALAIIGEPSSMTVVNAHKGIRVQETLITGQAAHSSQPAEGSSAILAASRLIAFLGEIGAELIARGDPSGRFDPPYTTLSVGTIKGGTAANIIPEHCRFVWEYRSLPTDDDEVIVRRLMDFAHGEVLPEMRKTAPAAAIETRPISHAPALRALEGSPAEALALHLAGQNAVHTAAYATEAGLFQGSDIPAVVCGPGDIAQAHKPDEFVEARQLAACDAFLDRLVEAVRA